MAAKDIRTKFIEAWNGLNEHKMFRGKKAHDKEQFRIEVTSAPIGLSSVALKQSMNGMSSLVVVKVYPHPEHKAVYGNEIRACGTSFDEAVIDLYKIIKEIDAKNDMGAVSYTVIETFTLAVGEATEIYAKCPACGEVITDTSSRCECVKCGASIVWPNGIRSKKLAYAIA